MLENDDLFDMFLLNTIPTLGGLYLVFLWRFCYKIFYLFLHVDFAQLCRLSRCEMREAHVFSQTSFWTRKLFYLDPLFKNFRPDTSWKFSFDEVIK